MQKSGRARVRVSASACLRIHLCACVRVCVCMYVRVHVCACAHVYVCAWSRGVRTAPCESRSGRAQARGSNRRLPKNLISQYPSRSSMKNHYIEYF